jgi:RIO kinase 1
LRDTGSHPAGRRRHRFDDDEPRPRRRGRAGAAREPASPEDRPEAGDRWSTWDLSSAGERGPSPYPPWLVTELAAVDTELGVLKTGKEADVHLLARGVPGTGRSCLLAAKRYRSAEHRMFHRDAGYLEGRRAHESRLTRAMVNRTDFGRRVIAGQWSAVEFGALSEIWQAATEWGAGPMVPYPVQLLGTEVLLEFIGDPETREAAPRLAALRPRGRQLRELWHQALHGMVLLARCGYAHGDLSPFNLLVHRGRLIMIDMPQIVDVIANPRGPEFLARDVRNVVTWFVSRGLSDVDDVEITRDLLREAGMRDA